MKYDEASSFSEVVKQLNSETDAEGRRWFQEKRKVWFPAVFWRMFREFFGAYFLKGGWRSGYFGFMRAVNRSLYQLISYAKYWELHEGERGKM